MSRARRPTAEPSAAMVQWPEPLDGTGWGVQIQRRHAPRDWPQALQSVPEEHRQAAEEYLRGMAARMRVIRRLTGGAPDGTSDPR